MANPPILFDFISKSVVRAETGPEAEQRYRKFLAQQQQQTVAASKSDSR